MKTLGKKVSLCPRYRVTVGIGTDITPENIRVWSLTRLYHYILTANEDKTKALNELWHPFTPQTKQERLLQHNRLEKEFPYFIAGHTFDRKGCAADEDDPEAGWYKSSGLIGLEFMYNAARGNEQLTINRRRSLEALLRNEPLLGPSINLITKVPGECKLIVVVAAGEMNEHWQRVRLISRYLWASNSKLYKCICGGHGSRIRLRIGFDPLAFFRSEPAEGYTIFPHAQALSFINHYNDMELLYPTLKKGSRRSRSK
jgi:hypothetical protein